MEQKRTKLAKQAEHLRVVNQEWNIYRDQVKDAKASIAEDQDVLNMTNVSLSFQKQDLLGGHPSTRFGQRTRHL
tara:strand:+ start:140 stop:361 length:222 start_codon:yes stop_codon:yes gene_type:complete